MKDNFAQASVLYQSIIETIPFINESAEKSEDETKTDNELKSLKVTAYTNLAVCQHKLHNWSIVDKVTTEVLSGLYDPNNVKALYFKANAKV